MYVGCYHMLSFSIQFNLFVHFQVFNFGHMYVGYDHML
jgi:hypothetical protein